MSISRSACNRRILRVETKLYSQPSFLARTMKWRWFMKEEVLECIPLRPLSLGSFFPSPIISFLINWAPIRPVSVAFPILPKAIFATPDSSSLLTLHGGAEEHRLGVHHWASLGGDGIVLELPELSMDSAVIASMGKGSKVFFITLDQTNNTCQSFILDITSKHSEFQLSNRDRSESPRPASAHSTIHNSLIDCHADIWARFPILHHFRKSDKGTSIRQRRSIQFVSSYYTNMFQPHFAHLVKNFKRMSKKPVGTVLASVTVSGTTYGYFIKQVLHGISTYKVGAWLTGLIGLVPVRIAAIQNDDLVPLKDGGLSHIAEGGSYGCAVNEIVDSLSFGWYESIFKSYMATKVCAFALRHLIHYLFIGRQPIKVVSSIGGCKQLQLQLSGA